MIVVIRIGGLILGGAVGYQVTAWVVAQLEQLHGIRIVLLGGGLLVGALLGLLLAVWIWRWFERVMGWVLNRLANVSLRDVSLGVLGLGSGLVLALLVGYPLARIPGVGNYLALAAAIALAYLGYHLVMQRRDEVTSTLSRVDR